MTPIPAGEPVSHSITRRLWPRLSCSTASRWRWARARTLSVLGRNGVGKTTLMSTIMGHTTLHGGTVRFGGSDIATLPVYGRAASASASCRRSAKSFLRSPSRRISTWPCGGAAGRSNASTISSRAWRSGGSNRGNQLSGGEQQMLAIGRALMGNPSLLLMDEPLEGLAPVIVEALLAGLDRLKHEDELALLMVEQHARIALDFTENAVILDRGAIVYNGPSATLRGDPERLAELVGVGHVGAAH